MSCRPIEIILKLLPILIKRIVSWLKMLENSKLLLEHLKIQKNQLQKCWLSRNQEIKTRRISHDILGFKEKFSFRIVSRSGTNRRKKEGSKK